MRFVLRLAKWLVAIVVVAVLGLAGWLFLAPPELIRVGAGYAAKIVCSNVFIAGRDADQVLQVDVQAPGHPLLRLMRMRVDREAGTVSVGLFGLFGERKAVARPGLGCTVLADGQSEPEGPLPTLVTTPPANREVLWPEGTKTEPSINAAFARILDDPALTGPGMRAIVLVHKGRIAGERYAPGFSVETPLLGWSMTKTVNAAILGASIKAGRLALDRKALFETWKGDERNAIAISDLSAMASGLDYNESYGDVSDVTRMLFLEPDMVAFTTGKPLVAPIGSAFNYSSGTAVLLSRLWQDAAGTRQDAVDLPRKALFGPLGMSSAVLEADAAGTFVGSSYLYATARDWARFGQFMLQGGSWKGEQILDESFVRWMREPVPPSNGAYGRGQLWLEGPSVGANEVKPDAAFGLPDDTYWAIGHDGQTIAIVPSRDLVVVRLGLTPSRLGYQPQLMVAELAKAAELVSD